MTGSIEYNKGFNLSLPMIILSANRPILSMYTFLDFTCIELFRFDGVHAHVEKDSYVRLRYKVG